MNSTPTFALGSQYLLYSKRNLLIIKKFQVLSLQFKPSKLVLSSRRLLWQYHYGMILQACRIFVALYFSN